MEPEVIFKHLFESKAAVGDLDVPKEAGVYAYFLRDITALAPLEPDSRGLVYVGQSSDLAMREFDSHFNSNGTGFSTLRRSIGAVLKASLRLTAIPRSAGNSESNVRNYRFEGEGEERLTRWMQQNLLVGVAPVPDEASVEKQLIGRLQPLLNLTGWPNPDRAEIKKRRKVCADEARSTR